MNQATNSGQSKEFLIGKQIAPQSRMLAPVGKLMTSEGTVQRFTLALNNPATGKQRAKTRDAQRSKVESSRLKFNESTHRYELDDSFAHPEYLEKA